MTDRSDTPDFTPYAGPAGGWGSLRSVTEVLAREGNLAGVARELLRQNKTDGFACVVVRVGQAGQRPSGGVLRERRQGDGVGADEPAGRCRFLRASPCRGAEDVARL